MGDVKSKVKSWLAFCGLLAPVAVIVGRLRTYSRGHATAALREVCMEVPERVTNLFFVKVGANDGLSGDSCSAILLTDSCWRGSLIQPVSYLFHRLQSVFNDPNRFLLQLLAIGSPEGRASFFYVDQAARTHIANLPFWYDQLGSFYRQHIVKHLDGALEPYIIEEQVPVIPLSTILDQYGHEIHLLHIDAEGYDFEVLRTLDFRKHRPHGILIEHEHLSLSDKQAMCELLQQHEYRIRDCGHDYFAQLMVS